MAATFTTNLGLAKPATGDLDWSAEVDANFDITDAGIYANRENGWLRVSGGGTVTYTASTGAITFTENIVITHGINGYTSTIPTSESPLICSSALRMTYCNVGRQLVANETISSANLNLFRDQLAIGPSPAGSNKAFLFAVRDNASPTNNIILFNGTTLVDGEPGALSGGSYGTLQTAYNNSLTGVIALGGYPFSIEASPGPTDVILQSKLSPSTLDSFEYPATAAYAVQFTVPSLMNISRLTAYLGLVGAPAGHYFYQIVHDTAGLPGATVAYTGPSTLVSSLPVVPAPIALEGGPTLVALLPGTYWFVINTDSTYQASADVGDYIEIARTTALSPPSAAVFNASTLTWSAAAHSYYNQIFQSVTAAGQTLLEVSQGAGGLVAVLGTAGFETNAQNTYNLSFSGLTALPIVSIATPSTIVINTVTSILSVSPGDDFYLRGATDPLNLGLYRILTVAVNTPTAGQSTLTINSSPGGSYRTAFNSAQGSGGTIDIIRASDTNYTLVANNIFSNPIFTLDSARNRLVLDCDLVVLGTQTYVNTETTVAATFLIQSALISSSQNLLQVNNTGTAGVVARFQVGGVDALNIPFSGAIVASRSLIFSLDATYNIGAPGVTRPNNVYVVNSVVVGSTAYGSGTITNTGILTLPTSTDTLVGRATTDTLTNKTIALASNSITGTASQIVVTNGSGIATTVSPLLAIPVFGASGPSHSVGLVPDPGSVAGTTRFLREDATWVVSSGGVGKSVVTIGVTGSGADYIAAGTGNDQVAFVAAAADPKLSAGGIIQILAGNYTFGAIINWSTLWYRGVDRNQVTISLYQGNNGFVGFTEFSGITFTNMGGPNSPFYLVSSQSAYFHECTTSATTGIQMFGGSTIWVDDCSIGGEGVQLDSNGPAYIRNSVMGTMLYQNTGAKVFASNTNFSGGFDSAAAVTISHGMVLNGCTVASFSNTASATWTNALITGCDLTSAVVGGLVPSFITGVFAGNIPNTANTNITGPGTGGVTIGPSGSGADYITTGTNDQTVFVAAAAALTSGGIITILAGTYNFGAAITWGEFWYRGIDQNQVTINLYDGTLNGFVGGAEFSGITFNGGVTDSVFYLVSSQSAYFHQCTTGSTIAISSQGTSTLLIDNCSLDGLDVQLDSTGPMYIRDSIISCPMKYYAVGAQLFASGTNFSGGFNSGALNTYDYAMNLQGCTVASFSNTASATWTNAIITGCNLSAAVVGGMVPSFITGVFAGNIPSTANNGGGGSSGFVVTGTPSSPVSVNPGIGISVSATDPFQQQYVANSAASPTPVAITSTPQIAPGSYIGQKLILKGTVNPIILDPTLSGSGIDFNGPITLNANNACQADWNGTVWSEDFRRA